MLFRSIGDKHSSNNKGSRYAVIIGINYTGQASELSGCQNDAKNMQQYMLEVGKVEPSNMTLLIDDGQHTNPTRANIMQALKALTRKVKPGDEAFVHYSGKLDYFVFVFALASIEEVLINAYPSSLHGASSSSSSASRTRSPNQRHDGKRRIRVSFDAVSRRL